MEGVEEEMVGFLEQSSVEIKGEARGWSGMGSGHLCKITQHLSPVAQSQVSCSFIGQFIQRDFFIQQCLPSCAER